jgi:ribonuclease P protein component
MPPRLRLPRAKRLILPAEFKRVREEGTAARGNLVTIGSLPAPDGQWRAGFVTSRRVGNAVVRNRLRRRLRDIARRHQHEIVTPTWLVTIARPAAARATSADLEHEWLRLAKRTSILAP